MINVRSVPDLIRLFDTYRPEFRRAWWVMLWVVVAGAVLSSPKYMSEARLLVKPGRENLSVPLDSGNRALYPDDREKRDALTDEEEILTGRPVLTAVAHLYLAELATEPQQKARPSRVQAALTEAGQAMAHALVTLDLTEERAPEDDLADKLAQRFKVSHEPGSGVLDLALSWNDPSTAQRIMKLWLKVYLDERTQALAREGLTAFYEAKVRDATQHIDDSKRQLRERLARIHGLSAKERLDDLSARIDDLHTRRAEIQAERSALQQGQAQAAASGEALPPEKVTARGMGPSAAWLAMSAQLSELKRQRADAMRVFKDVAPTVTALDDSIASLESQLQTEAQAVQQSERRRPNPLRTAMARSQLDKSVQVQELGSMAAALDNELGELEAARHEVLASEPELTRMEQVLRAAEKSRGQYLDSLEKARVDQALDDRQFHNIAQIEAPTLHPSRVSRGAMALVLMTLPMGLVAGLVVVGLSAWMDPRIHDGAGIEARFGVPVWTTLQDTGPVPNGSLDHAFQASLQRVYALLSRERIAQRGLTLGLSSARPGEGVSFVADQLARLLTMQGITAMVNPSDGAAPPGQVYIREGAGLLSNPAVFASLHQADLIVLVVEARASTVHGVDNALGILRTAYGQVHGVIVNRHRVGVPAALTLGSLG
jgi:uncharacterized protein involved in exopolysaccharide biosynthesis